MGFQKERGLFRWSTLRGECRHDQNQGQVRDGGDHCAPDPDLDANNLDCELTAAQSLAVMVASKAAAHVSRALDLSRLAVEAVAEAVVQVVRLPSWRGGIVHAAAKRDESVAVVP